MHELVAKSVMVLVDKNLFFNVKSFEFFNHGLGSTKERFRTTVVQKEILTIALRYLPVTLRIFTIDFDLQLFSSLFLFWVYIYICIYIHVCVCVCEQLFADLPFRISVPSKLSLDPCTYFVHSTFFFISNYGN